MLKTLIRLRLRQFGYMLTNRRRGKKSAKGMAILIAFLSLYLVAAFGLMFGFVFYGLHEAFTPMGMEWMYYGIAALMATGLCFVGSVFFTQSTIFDARDNELLLSMPVRPGAILGSRMALLLLLNYGYSLVIMLTAGVVRCIVGAFTVAGLARFIFCAILLPLLPSALSALVGWGIALLLSRVRNKTLFTTALSLIFLGAYFAVCFNMQSYVERMIANGAAIAAAIEKAMPPFYAMGLGMTGGQPLQLLRFALWCIIPFAVVYALLSRSFLRITTAKRGAKKVKYQAGTLRASSPRVAIIKKELRYMASSSPYILNGCMGAILCVAIAALSAIKGQDIIQGIVNIYVAGVDISVSGWVMASACIIECLTLSMCIISAPSLSLEGKNMPLLQSMPVKAADVLVGKALFHIIIAGLAAVVSSVLNIMTLPMTGVQRVLMIAAPLALVAFTAFLGVTMNLRFPRFDYLNETAVIKQSMSTTITMFSGLGVVLLPMLLYIFVLWRVLSTDVIIAIWTGLLLIASAAMYLRLEHGAERAFARLTEK
ncbi:MAG: hypothetical protein IJS53_01795 [Clostridia bacterium]|nr:hypothetical protein [Clostridia bacterium]